MRIAGVTFVAALIGLSCCQQLSARITQFSGSIEPVRWSELRHSYRAGCPVAPAALRTVHVSYRDFAGNRQVGAIVVAKRHAPAILGVFRKLWEARFPIRRLRPVSEYRGSDDASMEADNTSGFNCRFVGGTTRWSMHAYGEAIDVNPVENPYVRGGRVSPPAGRAYVDRSPYRKGMAVRGGVLVRAFASAGWKWGASFGDYQHFSTTGR
jgi:D-alanyl-D-alanine carboxypeptidase